MDISKHGCLLVRYSIQATASPMTPLCKSDKDTSLICKILSLVDSTMISGAFVLLVETALQCLTCMTMHGDSVVHSD